MGISKSRGFQGNIHTLSTNWRIQKFKRVSRKDIHKYDLDQNIIVRAWGNHICDLTFGFYWTIGGVPTT